MPNVDCLITRTTTLRGGVQAFAGSYYSIPDEDFFILKLQGQAVLAQEDQHFEKREESPDQLIDLRKEAAVKKLKEPPKPFRVMEMKRKVKAA